MNTYPTYSTGLGSLFASIARLIPDDQNQPVIVACPNCSSDDTKPVDLEFDIFECTSCGEVFTRQPVRQSDNGSVSTS